MIAPEGTAMALPRRTVLHLAAGAAAIAVATRPVRAQAYPARPIRLIVPATPGGVHDSVGRPWADRMKTLLGTVVVENQGGGGGVVGTAAAARAQPDGYTLLLSGQGAFVIYPLQAKAPLYDPVKDFEAIALLVRNAWSIAIHPSLPARNLKEFVDYAKKNPGKLSYGSSGVGSGTHLTGELFKSLTGTDMVHVPYRGVAPAVADLVSGQIPVATPSVNAQVIALHRSGKLRVLAVTTKVRISALSEVPTAVEAGLPDMVGENFVGLFAPGGTPKPIVERIAQATQTAMADASLQKMLVTSGFELYADSTPEKTRRFLADEVARWARIIKTMGLKLN
jgi:tripartite-type tricarboxylate transporter receptor subunit TctC